MPTREAVLTALLTKLSALGAFQTVSRKLDFDPEQGPTGQPGTPALQPALYLLDDYETAQQSNHGTPTKRTLYQRLLIWARIPQGLTPGVQDGVTPGSTVINNLLDAVETALAADNAVSQTCTLGGLVQRAWIEGTVVKVSGDLNPDGQCFASVPISILIP